VSSVAFQGVDDCGKRQQSWVLLSLIGVDWMYLQLAVHDIAGGVFQIGVVRLWSGLQ